MKKIVMSLEAAMGAHPDGADIYRYLARRTTRLIVDVEDDRIVIEPVEAALPNPIFIMIRKPLNRFFGSEAFLS